MEISIQIKSLAITSNEFLYDLCDWKIGDFSVVANR